MSNSIDILFAQKLKVSHAAHSLNSTKRQEIGIQAVGGNIPVSHVADLYGVSCGDILHSFPTQQELQTFQWKVPHPLMRAKPLS